MSVQCNTYVVWGSKIDPKELKSIASDDEDWYEKIEDYMDSAFEGIQNHRGITVLFDGMDGKYVVIGYVFAKSKNHDGLNEVISFNEVDTSVYDHFLDIFEQDIGLTLSNRGWMVLSHYR